MDTTEETTGGAEQLENTAIILKCHGCKAPTLFGLQFCHEADGHEYRAKSYCRDCERNDPLRGLVYRTLPSALVENQRVDYGCHVPDWATARCR